MKKYLALLLAGAVAFSVAGCGGIGDDMAEASTELNIYMWKDYISEKLIVDFEEQNGCTVNLVEMADRETSFQLLQDGCGEEYDLVMTSTKYMTALIDEKYAEKIDMDNVPNSSCIGDSYWFSKSYSIPYLMKYIYVVYDAKSCPVEIDSYSDLLSPELQGKILSLDGVDVLFPMALEALGYNPNTTEEEEIRKAYDWLEKFNANVAAYGTAKELDGNVSVAVTDDRAAAELMAQNKSIKIAPFVKNKVQLDTDVFVIPADAAHMDLAEKFLNYICDPEVMAENLKEMDYACPNEAAVVLADESYRKEPARDFAYQKKIFFKRDTSEAQAVYEGCYQQLKTAEETVES